MKLCRFILISLICLVTCSPGMSQIVDTEQVTDSLASEALVIDTGEKINLDSLNNKIDSLKKKERFKFFKEIFENKYPNPNRAAALSFILPGAGQVYNKKIWKLPFVYGALGGLGYMISYNQERYFIFRDDYLAEYDDDPDTVRQFVSLDDNALLTQRDAFNKRRQQGYIFFSLAWILNSVDAYVDAHLASFDVNEDITGHIQPTGIIMPGGDTYGLSLIFTTNPTQNEEPTFHF